MKIGNGKRNKSEGTKKSLDIESRTRSGKKNINDTSKEYPLKGSKKEKTVEESKIASSGVSPEAIPSKSTESGNEKSLKDKKKTKRKVIKVKKLPKMSGARKAGCAVMGMFGSIIVAVGCYGVYYNQVRYPSQMVEDVDNSGYGALLRFTSAVKTVDNKEIKGITGEDSYLAKELVYANGNEKKEEFIKKVIETVEYEPDEIVAKNKYGNVMLKKGTNDIVYTESLVNGEDEEVTLHYIDYSEVELDQDKIWELMEKAGLKPGDVDYSNRLVDVFCDYIVSIKDSKIPLVDDRRAPALNKKGANFVVTEEEEEYLDKVLFSSEEFYDLLERFSRVAVGSEEPNPEWDEWNKLPDEEKAEIEEPSKTLEMMQPSKEWLEWDSLEDKDGAEEPQKYDPKLIISMDWCGSYYLINEHYVLDENGNKVKQSIDAELGDGSLENPASIGTDVVTSFVRKYTTDTGEEKYESYSIRIRLTDFKVSEEAIEWFQTKDERNRGYDIKSEIQYCCYTYEVTNLSSETITITDCTSLSDGNANLAPRTGTVYGLQEEVTLKPDETSYIESWGNSTELNTKYLIWGNNFERKEPVVWFRVLSGDLEDKSEDKGVTLNKSRYE